MFSRLAHLQKITVVKGQLVKKGDLVGTVGTGNGQYSSHLHADFPREKLDAWTNYVFGISKGGVEHLYADPKPYQATVAPWQDHFGWNYLEWATYGERHCYHPGADYNGKGAGNADLGLPVYAPFDGKVVYCYDENGTNAGWGKLLIIEESMQSTPKPMQNNSNLRILDLSHWNPITDWNKIKDPVILKCTESTDYLDPTFKERQKISRQKGLYLGCYHFINPGKNPEQEALWYLKNIGEIKPNEILALDYELKLSNPVPICKRWLDTVLKETGIRAFIYLNESTTNKFDWSPISKGHKLWIAKYSNQ